MIINKKKILITAVIIILILLIFSFFYFIFFKKKVMEKMGSESKTLEEILMEQLTAPSVKEIKVSQDAIIGLSIPKNKKNIPISDDIIRSLIVPIK